MNEPEKNIDTGLADSANKPGPLLNSAVTPGSKPADLLPGTPGRVIPLRYPFKSGDTPLSEVTFTRRPKAGDLIQGYGAASAVEQELFQIAALLGINAEDLKEMDGLDYLAVQKEWAAFLGVQ